MSGPRSAGPWDVRSTRLLVGLEVIGGVMLVAAWEWSRDQVSLQDQYGSINLAVLGLITAAVGQVGWITAARRSVILRQRSALSQISGSVPAPHPAARRSPRDAGSAWVQVSGTRRGHRAHCQLVVGKTVVPLTRTDVEARALLPCELCS